VFDQIGLGASGLLCVWFPPAELRNNKPVWMHNMKKGRGSRGGGGGGNDFMNPFDCIAQS